MKTKYQLLTEELKVVESNNWHYFQSRPSCFEHGGHDSLFNHFIIRPDEVKPAELLFKPGSGLDEKVKKECLDVYKKIFGVLPPNLTVILN